MNGRLENELAIHKKTEAKVNEMPDFVAGWYSNLKASRKTAATCYDYIMKIHKFLSYIDKNVVLIGTEDITEDVVVNYFTSIQTKQTKNGIVFTSDSYQCTVWACLDNFLEYLTRHGLIETNYMKYIERPKNRDLDRVNENRTLLTENDFKSILYKANQEPDPIQRYRNVAILMMFMTTGIRKTALSSITLDNINLKEKTLVVIDKGSKRHVYSLNDDTAGAISNWLYVRGEYYNEDGDTHLFLSSKGTVMGARTITDVVNKYTLQALGKPLSPHKLRSGYCSILYNKTHDAEFVRRAVGHANISTTQRYIVTKGDERKKASEIMSSIL